MSGNECIFIIYHYDSNAIQVDPIQNAQAVSIIQAWHECFNMLKAYGEAPNIHIMDNECSFYLRRSFSKVKASFQPVSSYLHRRNVVERTHI